MPSLPKPPDPRPSKANPHHRATRKKIEKEHPHFTWVEGVILGLMGLTLAMNVEKDVEKHEQKHKREDEEAEERKRRGRERRIRYGSADRGYQRGRDDDRDYDRRSGRDRDRDRGYDDRRGDDRASGRAYRPDNGNAYERRYGPAYNDDDRYYRSRSMDAPRGRRY